MDRPHSPGQRPGTSLVSYDPRMEVIWHVPGQFVHWIEFDPGNLKIALEIIWANSKIARRIYFSYLLYITSSFILNFLAFNYFSTSEFSKLFFFNRQWTSRQEWYVRFSSQKNINISSSSSRVAGSCALA